MRKPVNTAGARNAALVNQLATPGLGSLMAGRWIAGSGQLALAVAGFLMVVVWSVKAMIQYYGQMFSDTPTQPIRWLVLIVGSGLFVLSWLWSLVTSVSLFLEARRNTVAELLAKNDSPGRSVPPQI